MNKVTISSPRSSSPLFHSENTVAISNMPGSITQLHTQSLSSLNDLTSKSQSSPGRRCGHPDRLRLTNRQPTSIVETKENLVKQAMLEKIQKQTEAFYQKTHCKPPLHPLPSQTPPTVPNEFNFATTRRASSRDRLGRKSGEPQERCRRPPCSLRSRSVTSFNEESKNRKRSTSRGSGRGSSRGRALTNSKSSSMDNKMMPIASTGQGVPFASCDASPCKQEIDAPIKQERINNLAEDPIQSKRLTTCRSLTTPLNIALNTEARVAVWQQRRQMRAEKDYQKRLAKEKEDAEREAVLKREIQVAPIKANPMPFYPAPPLPARSTKPLTQPVGPRFTIAGRAQRRNNSSGALDS